MLGMLRGGGERKLLPVWVTVLLLVLLQLLLLLLPLLLMCMRNSQAMLAPSVSRLVLFASVQSARSKVSRAE
jgi:hypothetical protein